MTEDQVREIEHLRCPFCGEIPEDLWDISRRCCGRWTSVGVDTEVFWPGVLSALRRAEELLGPVREWP